MPISIYRKQADPLNPGQASLKPYYTSLDPTFDALLTQTMSQQPGCQTDDFFVYDSDRNVITCHYINGQKQAS